MCFSFPRAFALSETLLAYLSPYKTGFSFNYLRGDIMSKCKTFLTLVVGLLFSLPAMAYSPPGNANTQHTTKIELKPASFLDMSRAYKTAAVCFLGVGDCDNEISYGKGGDGEDYTVDTAAQCKNEGFILNNCNSVQVPEGYCPYNKSYVTRCKCASNLVTCPAGQVGVGESCGGKYASCKCDPALKTCSSKEVGQGASCGGKYQSCACKSEYAYNTSNCTSPRSPSGDSCGGKYTQCTCPTGVSAGAYGCEEYYPAPCNTVCKKAYADNCRNRTAVSTPYGCVAYFADCSSKCQTAYTDNCRNRTAVSANYGCQTYWSDCSTKCQTAYADNCRNRTSVSCTYGCASYFSDCSSKCQSCYTDNCRNRTAVSTPYGCKSYFADCPSKCQTGYTACEVRTAASCSYGCSSYWSDCPSKCQTCKGNPDCDVSSLSCSYGCANTNSCGKCTACKTNPDCDVTSKTCSYGCASTNSCGKCTAFKSQGSCSDYGYSSTIKTPILLWTCDKVTINGLSCYDCYGNTTRTCPGGEPYSPCNCGGTHGGPGYAASHFC